DVHLQVFVTPTCPYCPRAVVLAHAMAIASDRVRADMVEATEFPHLSMKYNVMGVPRTVINDREFVEGAVPEYMLVDAIRAALRQGPPRARVMLGCLTITFSLLPLPQARLCADRERGRRAVIPPPPRRWKTRSAPAPHCRSATPHRG